MLAPTIQVKKTRKLLNEFRVSDISEDDLYLDFDVPEQLAIDLVTEQNFSNYEEILNKISDLYSQQPSDTDYSNGFYDAIVLVSSIIKHYKDNTNE